MRSGYGYRASLPGYKKDARGRKNHTHLRRCDGVSPNFKQRMLYYIDNEEKSKTISPEAH